MKRRIVGSVLMIGSLTGIAAVVFGPSLFRGPLTERATRMVSRSLGTEVQVEHAGVSLLRTFPRVNVALSQVSVRGAGEWSEQDFLTADSIQVSFDLIELVRGDTVARGLRIERPRIHAIQGLEHSNFDFPTPPSSSEPAEVELDHVEVVDMGITWTDETSGILVAIEDVDLTGHGDVRDETIQFSTETQVAELSMRDATNTWVHQIRLRATGDVEYGLTDGRVELQDFGGSLNELPVQLTAVVRPLPDRIDMKASASAPEADMKQLLSLVPAAWRGSLDQIEASGQVALGATVDGSYNSTTQEVPGFDMAAEISDGRVRLAGVPRPIDSLGLKLHAHHVQGPLETTEVHFAQASFTVGDSRFYSSGSIRDPLGDPNLDIQLDADLDLPTLAETIPDFEGTGRLRVAGVASGRASAFQEPRPDEVDAEGTLEAEGLELRTPTMPLPVWVDQASVELVDATANISSYRLRHGDTDLRGTATLDNLLGYALTGGVLSGTVDVESRVLDLAPFMTDTETATTGVLQLPPGLDLETRLEADEVRFDSWALADLNTQVSLRSTQLDLHRLDVAVAGGRAGATGTYTPTSPTEALVDLRLDWSGLDAALAAAQFDALGQMVPNGVDLQGAFSGRLAVSGSLDESMALNSETIDANGQIRGAGLALAAEALREPARRLGRPGLEQLRLDSAELAFSATDGNLQIRPTPIRLGGLRSELRGSVRLDGSAMDVGLHSKVPSKGLADTSLLQGLGLSGAVPSQVPVGLLVTGNPTNPSVRIDLSDVGAEVKRAAVDAAEERLRNELDAAEQVLRAELRQRADALVATAERQADRLIAAADRQADKLIAEADGNPLLQAGARKAAKKLRSTASDRAGKLKREARAEANAILQNSGG